MSFLVIAASHSLSTGLVSHQTEIVTLFLIFVVKDKQFRSEQELIYFHVSHFNSWLAVATLSVF